MSDESSLPQLVRGPDGTAAAVTADGLSVQSRTIEQVLEEILTTNRQIRQASLLLLNLIQDGFSLSDLGE